MQKRILILAGSHFQIPVIDYAKSRGHYVITCDNLPSNPGHILADKYYNVSTIDQKKILEVAKNEKIDGILAYGTDIAAPTAAFVSQELNLIGNPLSTIQTLTDKGLFRRFLSDNGLLFPDFKVFSNFNDAESYFNTIKNTVIVKPVDSSGSKGVTKLIPGGNIKHAYNYALSYSRKGEVIIEKEIIGKGPHIHGEAFVYNGILKFILLGDQYFSKINPCAPLSTTLPSMNHSGIIYELREVLQLIISLVKFNTGGLNIEIIKDLNDNINFIELGPRSGGNLMPELAMMATGFKVSEANVNAVLDEPINFTFQYPKNEFFTQIILHSSKNGRFKKINIPGKFDKNRIYELSYFSQGDLVNKYRGSQDVVGLNLYHFRNDVSCIEFIDFITQNEVVDIY